MLKTKTKPTRNSEARQKRTYSFDKRALSPIFATLIILAIVTVLFIPVFIWATGTTSQTQESWQTSGLIATERIVIEEVSLKAGATSWNFYVRNIGKTAVTINDVLIVVPDGDIISYENELSTVNPATGNAQDYFAQGELIEIEIADFKGLTLTGGQSYTVKVFTTRGVGDLYQVVA